VRRKKALQRLRLKAERQNKTVEVTQDECLYVDGSLFFSMKDGFVQKSVSSNVVNGAGISDIHIMASNNDYSSVITTVSFNSRGFNAPRNII